MALGFIKHVYRYFVPDPGPIISAPENCVPLYDPNGRIVGYIQQGSHVSQQTGAPPVISSKPMPTVNPPVIPVPIIHTPNPPVTPAPNLPVAPTPNPSIVPTPQAHLPVVPVPRNDSPMEWDGWPDGQFERDFTFPEAKATANLKCHWAVRVNGGDRKGDEHAESWQNGKRVTRRCLGILECDNQDCEVSVRPQTSPQGIDAQLRKRCQCGAQLYHRKCDIRALLWTWQGGIHYVNEGHHAHRRPAHILHILPNERIRFETIVKNHPQVGPLGLIVGVPGIDGPGESIADISDVFLNADRVSKERQKLKHGDPGGDDVLAAFAKFEQDHLGFVIYSIIGQVTVVCVQSSFMRSQLVKERLLDGPINGMVNDGAHKFWRQHNCILMVTSTYCPSLFCWVPGVLSYTNGSSAQHFRYHFLAVFQSIVREAEDRFVAIADRLFAGVMDFSEAEREGWILAFIDLWILRRDNHRTEDELRKAAECLLRGCQEHFRAGVTRGRHNLDPNLQDHEAAKLLMRQRDVLRRELRQRRAIGGLDKFESLWVWLGTIVRGPTTRKKQLTYSCASLYFQFLLVDIHECSGSPEIGGRHLEITAIPRHQTFLQVGASESQYQKCGGNIAHYFEDFFSINKEPIPQRTCWRVREGETLCTGKREDIQGLVISIPVILTVEVANNDAPDTDDSLDNSDIQKWDFPPTLTPLTQTDAEEHGIIYDLVGFALLTSNRTHFIARYASEDHSTIYTYDGRAHDGCPVQETNAKLSTHISGRDIIIPKGSSVYQAFYFLRGGTQAQDIFFERQTQALRQKHPVTLSGSTLSKAISMMYHAADLTRMDKKERYWMKDPYARQKIKYISNTTKSTATYSRDSLESEDPISLSDSMSEVDKMVAPAKSQVLSDTSSLPDSLFSLNCRWEQTAMEIFFTQKAKSERLYNAMNARTGRMWLVSEREGRATWVKTNLSCATAVICRVIKPSDVLQHATHNRKIEGRTMVNRPLKDRLRRGTGALARRGVFWYPVRIIHVEDGSKWRVRWWRECNFAEPGIDRGSVTTVGVDDIVDSLWLDRTGRRKIRLGQWTHAMEIPTSEDILCDPSLIPFTTDIDNALLPSLDMLKKVLKKPENLDNRDIPAKAWLEDQKKSLTETIVPFVGGLSIAERAKIANWFEVRVCEGDKKLRQYWLGFLPIAHAHTIFLSSRIRDTVKDADEHELLARAWKAQYAGDAKATLLVDIDVDKECLESLKELMFERSSKAGIAGNCQWGLDAGDHQECWDPYQGIPSYWNYGDRSESEGELEVRLQFLDGRENY
ncbi:hypothetical protein BDZ97DRAFT_1764147 [Flammula alnicola]|nr:hypothetical protein BDZ97DRAFT_1764147 [Flammula alnicola]